MQTHFIGQVKTTMGEYGQWCAPNWPQTRICHNLECNPWTVMHAALAILKSTYRFQILMLERKKHTGVRTIPRCFGMLASGFTQCQYLTTKNSMPCHTPVISALVGCLELITVLKAQPWDLFKIHDLRIFDLNTQHTLITRQFNSQISRKRLLPCNIGVKQQPWSSM